MRIRDGNTDLRRFLMGLVIGITGGAAAALLYAPARGAVTRDFLAEGLAEGVREGRYRAAVAAETGRDIVNQGRDVLTTAFAEGRDAYRQTKASGAV
jgi:gas vesicle protein